MHSIHADHAHHEPALIAGHAAGDLTDSERAAADALLSSCEPCAELRRDLVAIAAATRSLPAPAALARDLRLDPAQADRLRRGSRLRGLLRPFGAPRSAVRPMAAAFTSLGIAGLFVATILPGVAGLAGSPAAGPGGQSRDLGFEAASEPTSAPAAQPAPSSEVVGQAAHQTPYRLDYAQRTAVPVRGTDTSYDGATSIPPVAAGGKATDDTGEDDIRGAMRNASSPSINPLLAGSLGLLGVGLLLFAFRLAARRLR